MNFEEYLISKKIDVQAFKTAEPGLWNTWRSEFDQMHPNSFTAQKLYLINPLRRRFHLKGEPKPSQGVATPDDRSPEVPAASAPVSPPHTQSNPASPPQAKPVIAKPAMPKPVFKPKPKTS